MSKREDEVTEGAECLFGGRPFQAEGTANSKVLGQDMQQLQGTGARQVAEKE